MMIGLINRGISNTVLFTLIIVGVLWTHQKIINLCTFDTDTISPVSQVSQVSQVTPVTQIAPVVPVTVQPEERVLAIPVAPALPVVKEETTTAINENTFGDMEERLITIISAMENMEKNFSTTVLSMISGLDINNFEKTYKSTILPIMQSLFFIEESPSTESTESIESTESKESEEKISESLKQEHQQLSIAGKKVIDNVESLIVDAKKNQNINQQTKEILIKKMSNITKEPLILFKSKLDSLKIIHQQSTTP
ncbi:MAG: hypothetical protein HQK49_04240 [Oligoflexia bacterium]|nr:hypothetical protein [Oligoflexia bacterium]